MNRSEIVIRKKFGVSMKALSDKGIAPCWGRFFLPDGSISSVERIAFLYQGRVISDEDVRLILSLPKEV